MAIIAKSDSEKKFDPISEGVHLAVCYGIIDLGDQWSEQFKKTSRKIQLLWELPHETYIDKDGQERPRFTSKEYTLSLGEKSTLRKDLQAWRNKAFTEDELAGFDLQNILGKACQISIIHKENNGALRANIAGIMALTKGTQTPPLINQPIYFDLNSEDPIEIINEYLNLLPEWIKNKVKESSTYKDLSVIKDNQDDIDDLIGDDEIPF